MHYLKNFSSVEDANQQGANGLLSPHISIVEGKSAINIYKANNETFTCSFDNDGNIVIPTEEKWRIIETYHGQGEELPLDFFIGYPNGAGAEPSSLGMEDIYLTADEKRMIFTETSTVNTAYTVANNDNYVMAIFCGEDAFAEFIYDKTSGKYYYNYAISDLNASQLYSEVEITEEENEYWKPFLNYHKGFEENLIEITHIYKPTKNELLNVMEGYRTNYIANGGNEFDFNASKTYLSNDDVIEFFIWNTGLIKYKYNGGSEQIYTVPMLGV